MLATAAVGASRHVQKLLRQCGSVHYPNQLHAHLVVHGSLHTVASQESQILASYCALSAGGGGHGGLCYARDLFDIMPDPNRFMYNNNLIRAYCNSHCPQETLRLHRGMIQRSILPNEFTLPFVLKVCARTQAWEHV
ncbi:hypothetical protein E2562_008809 [Oryza meyeriana var. granulata]|uniref:Pentatricopeptide repeat-containing protein n=1 Tax=Oryza meyeriana var. granulata TaxID=110450 RepID=A0A6G1CZ54_9ORYZ|nr:hypothetical protein E2562_008809 [Oryza meyeriana var. granulata]